MASIKDCALSLLAAHDLRRGNLISDDDHDRIVGRVRRDINKNNGVAGLIAEGQHKVGRCTAIGRLSEIANALVGPVERQYECRHVVLHWMNRSKAPPISPSTPRRRSWRAAKAGSRSRGGCRS